MSPQKPYRRWFQFSVRTLLILTTIIAVALAWWSHTARRQREAVAAIQWAGPVYYDFQTFQPGSKHYHYYFEDVMVNSSPAYWPKWLVDAMGVDYFASVESVWIPNQSWADDNCELLQPFTRLKRLGLQGTWASDTCLERIKGLTSLELLDLDATTITDAGLRHLKGMTALRELYLVQTEVTDAGLEHLKDLTALQMLDLRCTNVTAAAVERLQQALPNCKILYSGRVTPPRFTVRGNDSTSLVQVR